LGKIHSAALWSTGLVWGRDNCLAISAIEALAFAEARCLYFPVFLENTPAERGTSGKEPGSMGARVVKLLSGQLVSEGLPSALAHRSDGHA